MSNPKSSAYIGRLLFFAMALLSLTLPSTAKATPAFARAQGVGCPVCHTAFPELNSVGRQFKENGFRFLNPETKDAITTGRDLGDGIKIDNIPGVTFRIESMLAEVSGGSGESPEISTQPLDAAELIATGISGDHWTYMAEIASEAGDGYTPAGNGLIQYRVGEGASLFAGWVPMFQRDGYNQLSESRRIDHSDHAASDFSGSLEMNLNTEAEVLGANGRIGPVFYLVETTPGPDIIDPADEPFDYLGRVEVDVTDGVSVGGYVYSGNTEVDSTMRVAGDLQALTSAGNFKVVGMYDTLDSTVAFEAGWDMVKDTDTLTLLPLARVDLLSAGSSMSTTPMLGLALQQSSARLQLEVSEPLGGGSISAPDAVLLVDGVF